ncbi:MAG: hypothetical protein R3E68_14825 [Burkholderiaceae bacterium]
MQLGKVAVVMAMILTWWLFNPAPSGPPSEGAPERGSLARSMPMSDR